MPYIIVGFLAVIAFVTLQMRAKAAYYRKIFSEANYRQIGEWVVEVLQRGEVERPSLEDGTALVTDAGVAVGFSRIFDDEFDRLHFSISQRPGPTTHAVGGRIMFFLMLLLNKNKSNADCAYTKSTVHHFVIQKQRGTEWSLNPVDESISGMENYRPLPLELKEFE